jgi:transcriptional regulator with XRE-family HTH domain
VLQIRLDQLPEGRRLKVARIAAGLTLWDLAQRANVQPPRISEYERGHGRLSPDALDRVYAVLAGEIASGAPEGERATA